MHPAPVVEICAKNAVVLAPPGWHELPAKRHRQQEQLDRPVAVPAVPPMVTAPIVDEANSLLVVKTEVALSRLAVRLPAAKAVFSWSSDSAGAEGHGECRTAPFAAIVMV